MPPDSTQSLPREITFNPVARTLEQSPVEELVELRTKPVFVLAHDVSSKHSQVVLFNGTVNGTATSSSSGEDRHQPPSAHSARTKFSPRQSESLLEFVRPRDNLNATLSFQIRGPGANFSCGVGPFNQTETKNDPASKLPFVEVPVRCGAVVDVLRLLHSESSIFLRLFVDATFVEAYWQNGRTAMTAAFPSGVLVGGDTELVAVREEHHGEDGGKEAGLRESQSGHETWLRSAKVYGLKSIWISEAEMRGAPRVYGGGSSSVGAAEAVEISV